MEFIYGIATGAVTTILLLVLVRWAVFAERDAQVSLASPLPRPTVPDKLEPRHAANNHPAIPTHPRLHLVSLAQGGANVVPFRMRGESRDH